MAFRVDTENLHPTTELSLQALQWLQERADFNNILEIGCGSGILSIVAAQAWEARVLAADISPKAVADTKTAIEAHQLQQVISATRSDGFAEPSIRQCAPYDLIVCNLLADILLKIAKDVKVHLKPGGYAILAGSLVWMTPEVEMAYKALGFEIAQRFELSPWHACVIRDKTET